MHKETREELMVRLKIIVLVFKHHFDVTKACRECNVARSTFYRWKQKYDIKGRSGLYRESHIANNHPWRTSPEVVEKS